MDSPRRRQKVSLACQRCRSRKSGCDRRRPCQLCVRAGVPCVPTRRTGSREQAETPDQRATPRFDQSSVPEADKVVLPEQSIMELSTKIISRDHPSYDTSALPGGSNVQGSNSPSVKSWQAAIGLEFPSKEVLDALVDQFFNSVNWFMMVFHEEYYRERYKSLLTSTHGVYDDNFLWLASLVLGLGAHYSSLDTTSEKESALRKFSQDILTRVEQKFCFIIGSPNVETIQICILLGSFHLFNGRPTVGIGILGSGVKIAQIMGLHRESMWKDTVPIHRELRRRAWWALEVFDKYAAIAFGRPCTIDESDCSVQPPVEVNLYKPQGIPGQSTLLEYHRQKFRLYRIMGPFLGRRCQTDRLETVNSLHDQLKLWQMHLPLNLQLQTYQDYSSSERPSLDQLQALALQLTYDNLKIILHRSVAFRHSCHDAPYTGPETSADDTAIHREELLQAALRTSQLGQYSHIIHACRRTHAVMHVGICLFTAGIVLCALSLCEPLSPLSQKAKTGIMAIIRMHKNTFTNQHLLSAQSVRILQDAVAAVMQFEQRFILGDISPPSLSPQPNESIDTELGTSSIDGSHHMGEIPRQAENLNEAFLAPLQEVFAQHLQAGADRTESMNSLPNEQASQSSTGRLEKATPGLPNFSWDGDLFSTIDPEFADANQLWLWSDSTLANFL